MKSGQRLSPEDIQEVLIMDLSAEIARDEQEVEMIEKALLLVEGDPLFFVVKYKYFEGKNDGEIAELTSCDPSTIRRNKSRLVARLAVFLYGAAAAV
jgi:DNA-directed RNA polymerase specialized sigma24 family protein